MCTTFVCFLAALLSFESGWDRDRYEAGVIEDWQLTQWAGGPVETSYPQYSSWSQLSADEWEAMSYRSTNSLGFVGYQFGEALLIDLGYYQDDVYYGAGASTNTWDGTWTGKHGVTSLDDFKTKEAQTFAIQEAFGYNLQILQNQLSVYGKSLDDYIGQTRTYTQNGAPETVELTLSGILAASHLRGAWGTASLLLEDSVTADENGTSILQYVEQFGGYEIPGTADLIAFHDGRVIGDEGLGSLLLPGEETGGGGDEPASVADGSDTDMCEGEWYTANLTNYTSYPDPGSEECVDYNGCTWAGQFYGMGDQMSEQWVRQNNIAAVHMKDWNWLGNKTLRLRQNTRTIIVKAIDACSDTDCNNCCTKNLGGDGYLIDIEKYTMERFQSGSGEVEFQLCDSGNDSGDPETDPENTASQPESGPGQPADSVFGSGVDTIHIGYAWGEFKTVSGFDPAEDRIDFGSMPGADILIEDSGEGLKVSVRNSGGSGYLLQGVQAKDLSISANVTASDWNPVITETGGIADQLRRLGSRD